MIGLVLPLLLAAASPAAVTDPAPLPAAVTDPAAMPAEIAASAPAGTLRCLPNREIRTQRMARGSGYFAQTRQGWWRNMAPACPLFRSNALLASVSTMDSKCQGDIVQIIDRLSGMTYGGCGLGAWQQVPASAVPPASAN